MSKAKSIREAIKSFPKRTPGEESSFLEGVIQGERRMRRALRRFLNNPEPMQFVSDWLSDRAKASQERQEMRTRKKPTRRAIEDENENLRYALDQIVDVLEEIGWLEPADPENVGSGEDEDELLRRVIVLNEEPKVEK